MENNLDIILDRAAQGICPICTKVIELEYRIIEDLKYGKVRICRNHKIVNLAEETFAIPSATMVEYLKNGEIK